jgi:hypothetical protein
MISLKNSGLSFITWNAKNVPAETIPDFVLLKLPVILSINMMLCQLTRQENSQYNSMQWNCLYAFYIKLFLFLEKWISREIYIYSSILWQQILQFMLRIIVTTSITYLQILFYVLTIMQEGINVKRWIMPVTFNIRRIALQITQGYVSISCIRINL